MQYNVFCIVSKKKAGLHRPMPLRHIGYIVIWEGNYIPDIINIGIPPDFLEPNFAGDLHSFSSMSIPTERETR